MVVERWPHSGTFCHSRTVGNSCQNNLLFTVEYAYRRSKEIIGTKLSQALTKLKRGTNNKYEQCIHGSIYHRKPCKIMIDVEIIRK